MNWHHIKDQKRHTQDGCQLALLMKESPERTKWKALDVGCGDGIITHEMLRLHRARQVWAFDISKEAVSTASVNLGAWIKDGRVKLSKCSASSFFKNKAHWDSFDLFVINPPFFPQGSGRENKKGPDQKARHEGSLHLKLWARGARKVLKTGGILYCVFPSERMAECLSELSCQNVEPKEIWWFKDDKKKRRFFLKAVRNAKVGLIHHFDVELKRVGQ